MGTVDSIDHFVRSYGDLLYDLCEELLSNSTQAQSAFRSILKKIRSGIRYQKYSHYQRSWVLKIACSKILLLSDQFGHQVSPEEQMELDASENATIRMKHFKSYFYRLKTEDQILLLLKDKHGIPYSEIAAALDIPEGSLKVRRQQALRTLEEWLWNNR